MTSYTCNKTYGQKGRIFQLENCSILQDLTIKQNFKDSLKHIASRFVCHVEGDDVTKLFLETYIIQVVMFAKNLTIRKQETCFMQRPNWFPDLPSK